MGSNLKSLEINFNNWSLYLTMGSIFLLTGIWGFSEHLDNLLAFKIFISIAILVSGGLKIIFSILDKKIIDNWKGSLINGIIVLILGAFLIYLSFPLKMLALFLGVILFRYAYNAISHAFEIRNYLNHWRWFAAFSFPGAIFAFLLIIYPWFHILSRLFYASLSFSLLGLFDIVYAFLFRRKLKIE
jgi:uncharacterized membrane protein HdeD (DUF308 family)